MFRKTTISFFFLAAIFLSLPNAGLACACCAEPGLYHLRTGKPSTYELGLMKEFEFSSVAKLYLTEADFAMIKGAGRYRERVWERGIHKLWRRVRPREQLYGKALEIRNPFESGKTRRADTADALSDGNVQGRYSR